MNRQENQTIPNGYLAEDGSFFPDLETVIKTLDLNDPISRGHLIAGRLGTIPLNIRNGILLPQQALNLVAEFNKRTGLEVKFDVEKNKLVYV